MLFYSVINVRHQNATTKGASAAIVRCGKNDAGKLRFKRTNQVPKYYLSKFQKSQPPEQREQSEQTNAYKRTKCGTTILFTKLGHSSNIFPIFHTFNLPHWHRSTTPPHLFPDLFLKRKSHIIRRIDKRMPNEVKHNVKSHKYKLLHSHTM